MPKNTEPVSPGTFATLFEDYPSLKEALTEISTALDEIYGEAHGARFTLTGDGCSLDSVDNYLRQIENFALLALKWLQPYLG